MSSATSKIWWDPAVQAYRMSVPYNPAFQELFKKVMPHSDRMFDPQSKIWTWPEKYFDAVKMLVTKTFGTPLIITRADSEKATAPPPVKTQPLDQLMLNFFKLLPYEAAQKAYRSAAMLLHPDRGGDMNKMADLNSIWQRLEVEFYKISKGN